MELTAGQMESIRKKWRGDPSFLGFPDAERDAADTERWLDQLLVRPRRFETAMDPKTTVVVGRKGVGKSAARIASGARLRAEAATTLVVEASADELASRHAAKLGAACERGFGAVADWCQVFAELIVRNVARDLTGTLVTNDDDDAVRKWATMEGISERDFGERVVSAIGALVPWAQKVATERAQLNDQSGERFRRVADARAFTLFIDDFDNLQETRSLANMRLIRDAVEAADRITHQNDHASVHLSIRQDLWLRLRPGWHYADKMAGVVQLNWSQSDLLRWARRRLLLAAADSLGVEPTQLSGVSSEDLWKVFYPEKIMLRNEKESTGLHYMVRRTMYTPRALRQFMALVISGSSRLPTDLRDIENAEEEFSVDQIEFLKTEFGALCDGLDVCLQSFTTKRMELKATDLYKHLNGLMGNGQLTLQSGASDGSDAVALARFLFRIGFLEVRYPDGERFEVRDAMRHPDHWKSIRKDDSVRWAVRSAFFCALRGRAG